MRALAAVLFLLGMRPAAADTNGSAAAIERRLDELSARLKRQNAAYERESLAMLSELTGIDEAEPGSASARRAEKAVALLREKYPNAAMFLEMTILARRLQAFKETGRLPAAVPDSKAILDVLREPWKKTAPLPDLELSLPKLIKQLRRYESLTPPALRPAKRGAPETFPASADKPKAAASPPPRAPALERDAGRGRMETDPIPELILQLSSPDPRRRALSADELGARGGAAARAVPGLRRALSDPDARVRASAALALGSMGRLSPEAVEDIRRACLDKNEDVRFNARRALELLGLR
ncbi:MAG: HEAT repeat domain-containing protein [Elusimicrobia bacterium]|nr:HEAT repeat domain-containing protein [Elusimicrobiota bacterium]